MILTSENYYGNEANEKFLSVSQYKDFVGVPGNKGCEACAMAKLDGSWQDESKTALMVGSYVDSYFEGNLPQFKDKHPEIFTKQGGLKAEYKQAESIISRIERDEYFMKFLSGEKQVIMTGEITGAKFKIKIDSYIPDTCIVDLKIMRSIRDTFYVAEKGKVSFITQYGYDIQGAVYQEIVRQNTGKVLPFYIAAASKEPITDIEIIQLDDDIMAYKLSEMSLYIPEVIKIKRKEKEPVRCGICDYCRFTKKLTAPISQNDLSSIF